MGYSEEFGYYYMLDNPLEVLRGLTLSAGAYFEYKQYANALLEIEEQFDESIEAYDPITWLYGLRTYTGKKKTKKAGANRLTDEAESLLRSTTDKFSELVCQSLNSCKAMIKNLLILNEDKQYAAVGFSTDIEEDRIEKLIDYLFDYIDEMLESENDEFQLTFEPLQNICENDGIALVLQCLYDIKDQDIPKLKPSSTPIAGDMFTGVDIRESMVSSMEKFIEMRKTQVPCICPECRSTWHAEPNDLAIGTILCPGCQTPMVPFNIE